MYCVAILALKSMLKFNLYSVYNVKNHKKYQNGQWTEKQCLEEFLKSFEAPESIDGKVCHLKNSYKMIVGLAQAKS